MSMPKFPEIDQEITLERALNMILTSIAMEELSLSHIINAEGEKLQYVLGTLETRGGLKPDIDEILKINYSVTSLLDSVSQNQMILKNKMDKALYALSEVCPKPPNSPCRPEPLSQFSICSSKCSAFFKAFEKCRLWFPDTALNWNAEHMYGKSICFDSCDRTKIGLYTKGRFIINLSVNIRAKSLNGDTVISLKMIKNNQNKDIYSVHRHISCDDKTVTLSINGIIIENNDDPSSLSLKLESHDSLIVEDSMLSIMEI